MAKNTTPTIPPLQPEKEDKSLATRLWTHLWRQGRWRIRRRQGRWRIRDVLPPLTRDPTGSRKGPLGPGQRPEGKKKSTKTRPERSPERLEHHASRRTVGLVEGRGAGVAGGGSGETRAPARVGEGAGVLDASHQSVFWPPFFWTLSELRSHTEILLCRRSIARYFLQNIVS